MPSFVLSFLLFVFWQNEKVLKPFLGFFQVYKVSIGAACNLSWPADRLVVQVLDDSTDPTVKVKKSNAKLNCHNHY